MRESRKQAVSIRLGAGDIRKLKLLAERLGVRDSDVIRFALKWSLNRVAPLCDPEIRGKWEAVHAERGTTELHLELARRDPDAATALLAEHGLEHVAVDHAAEPPEQSPAASTARSSR